MDFEKTPTEEIQSAIHGFQAEKESARNKIRAAQSVLDSRSAVDSAREKLKGLSKEEVAALRSVIVTPEPVQCQGIGQELAG
jgi:hypothetical protein